MTVSPATTVNVAPGSTVVVRDEEWLVTSTAHTADGILIEVQGLSELVRDTTATFYEGLDTITPYDPALARVIADGSSQYRRARLWVEATLRKTPVPLADASLTVSPHMLADQLTYQRTAITQALDPENLRPRILLADAVGLGKTIEIGMILAELVRRGRGDRILIVTPRHVLEQMQHEMWTRFALPFVRLDSVGIQRVRQKLPSSRNPFTFYKRAIISIDTLKSDQNVLRLQNHHWDAVVIDESHNITNSATQNNRLARTLAPNTDALILASATPHNGKAESFAELIRLLEPTAVRADGTIIEEEAKRLIIRRHRHSDEVAREVGASWAERKEPQNWLVAASLEENAVALELEQTWLHPKDGNSPYSGTTDRLFSWTLAKAFLSSPAALRDSIAERKKRVAKGAATGAAREIEALHRLAFLNDSALAGNSAKYAKLVEYLKQIGVGKGSPMRAVVFAERVATLHWLQEQLPKDLGLAASAVEIMHGQLADDTQQKIVEGFKQESSPIRVLVTGDVASEGVNLHRQCHELIHFDIPWSLIRIEQRNGRIDRYGQLHPPQITTLLLEPSSEQFRGDLKVITRLLDREKTAHTALGDVASLMGKYDVAAEEDEIRKVLAGQKSFDTAVAEPEAVTQGDGELSMLARLLSGAVSTSAGTEPSPAAILPVATLYDSTADFLRDVVAEAFTEPDAKPANGGIGWRERPPQSHLEFVPPRDLQQRLEVLPQTYLHDRGVQELFKLATSVKRGEKLLNDALADEKSSSWPEAHFLGPLHPVLDWATDRALSRLERNHIFAVRGEVAHPTVLLVGTLTNRRGQVVAAAHLSVEFPNAANPRFATTQAHPSARAMLAAAGFDKAGINPGAITNADALQPLVAAAVAAGTAEMAEVFATAEQATLARVDRWSLRASQWEHEAEALVQRTDVQSRRASVKELETIVAEMRPDRQLVRPLLVVVPKEA